MTTSILEGTLFGFLGGMVGGVMVLLGETLFRYIRAAKMIKDLKQRNRVIAETEAQEARKEVVNPGFKIRVVTEEDEWAREQNNE